MNEMEGSRMHVRVFGWDRAVSVKSDYTDDVEA